MATGGIFAKYEFGAAPQKRFVWLSDDLSYLHWKVLGIVKNYSTVLVRDIIGVVQGAKTPVLKDHGKDGKSRGEGITVGSCDRSCVHVLLDATLPCVNCVPLCVPGVPLVGVQSWTTAAFRSS